MMDTFMLVMIAVVCFALGILWEKFLKVWVKKENPEKESEKEPEREEIVKTVTVPPELMDRWLEIFEENEVASEIIYKAVKDATAKVRAEREAIWKEVSVLAGYDGTSGKELADKHGVAVAIKGDINIISVRKIKKEGSDGQA